MLLGQHIFRSKGRRRKDAAAAAAAKSKSEDCSRNPGAQECKNKWAPVRSPHVTPAPAMPFFFPHNASSSTTAPQPLPITYSFPTYASPVATATTSPNMASPFSSSAASSLSSSSVVVVTLTNTIFSNLTTPAPSSSVSPQTSTLTLQVTATAPSAAPAPTAPTAVVSQTLTSAIATATLSAFSPSPDNFAGHTGSIGHPNDEQIKTIWVAAVMLVALLVGWNMIILRDVLHPWKMWGALSKDGEKDSQEKEEDRWRQVNTIHESGHILVGIITGAKVFSVSIDPEKGPISGMTGGAPFLILAAGYPTSVLAGSALIMAAFDTSASKVAALIVYPLLIVCFWFGRTWARLRVLMCMGVSIAFFFIKHAAVLRYYILFLGVMNAFYVLWDVLDDQMFRKSNESDVSLFARLSPPTVHAWILIWLLFTFGMVALGIIGGLHFFDKTAAAQQAAQAHFLPV